MNSKEFSLIIEGVVKDKKPITYLDAIILYCETENIEVETASRMITKSLKEKIKSESAQVCLLKGGRPATLPV
jgi:hypothetical protein|tara:strand:- start:437 stop:655 length:219 start_codon:yes stop_codon:yes gene_type:complete